MSYLSRMLPALTSNPLVLRMVSDQMILVEEIQCYGGQEKTVRTKVFHAAWGIEHKDTCPQYDNYQIRNVGILLKRA